MLLFYELALEAKGAHGLFIPIRSKRSALINAFTMIKRSSWSQYMTRQPESGDYFAFDQKLGRAFIVAGDTTHSIAFPFTLIVSNQIQMASVNWKTLHIGADVASLAISVLSEANDPYVNLIDSVRRIANDDYNGIIIDHESVAYMLSDLIDLDDGYFRHEHDPAHANGRVHPIDHIDFYHADSVSIKIGVEKRLSLDTIQHIASEEHEAFYLEEPR